MQGLQEILKSRIKALKQEVKELELLAMALDNWGLDTSKAVWDYLETGAAS